MGYVPYSCGFQRITVSGVISDSGKPILIAGYCVESGATAAQPVFKNGTAVASPNVFTAGPIIVSQGNVLSLPLPVMFPLGCFVSFDANTTAVTAFYILQSVSS